MATGTGGSAVPPRSCSATLIQLQPVIVTVLLTNPNTSPKPNSNPDPDPNPWPNPDLKSTLYRRTCRVQLQRAGAKRRERGVQPRQARAAGQNAASAPGAAELALSDAKVAAEPTDAPAATPDHAPDGHDVGRSDTVQPEPAQPGPHHEKSDSIADSPPSIQLPAVAPTETAAASELGLGGAARSRKGNVSGNDIPLQSSAAAVAVANAEPGVAEAQQLATSLDADAGSFEQQRGRVTAPSYPESPGLLRASIADGASSLPAGDEPLSAAAPDAAAAVGHAQPQPATPVSEPQPGQSQSTGRGAIAPETLPVLPAAADGDSGPDAVTDILTSEQPDSVPDATAVSPEDSPYAEPQRSDVEAPGSTMAASAAESEEDSGAEGGLPAAEVSPDPPQATAAEPEPRCNTMEEVPEAEDPAPDAHEPLTGADDVTAPRWPVLQLTELELSSVRQRLDQQPCDASQHDTAHRLPAQHAVTVMPDETDDSPSHAQAAPPASSKAAQHAETAAGELAEQPETPLPSRLVPASPSDTTEPSQGEPAAQTAAQTPPQTPAETPAMARGEQELQSFAALAVHAGAEAEAIAEAAQEQLASCARPQQAQTSSQAAPAQEQATVVSGGQRGHAAPRAAAAPAAGPASPDEPAACEAATLPQPQSPQQAVTVDMGDALPAIAPGAAAMPPAAPMQLSAEPAPRAVSPNGASDADHPPRPSVPAVSDAAPQRCAPQQGVMQGRADSPLVFAASQRVTAPCAAPQQPAADIGMELDDIDIEARDADAAPAEHDAVAATLVARLALQKEARTLLAPVAGCSRAVPQHAVALMATLWGSAAAQPSGVDAINSLAGNAQRQRVSAACWRDQAERRGCARAVSRVDVTSLVGLLSPAESGVDPFQVRHLSCCVLSGPSRQVYNVSWRGDSLAGCHNTAVEL